MQHLTLFVLVVVAVVAIAAGADRKCAGNECQCVGKKGKTLYKNVRFPASEDYNCAKKPKKCQKQRFNGLLNNKFVPECDANGKFVAKQCEAGENPCASPAPNAINCGSVKIQSKNFPRHFFGGANPAAISTSASLFNVVSPGLTGEAGTVSFQSANQPNSYLRHFDFIMYLEDKDTLTGQGKNIDTVPLNAVFRFVEDKFFPGFVSFESVNFPGRFLRHQGYTLKLHPDDGSVLMHNDASFKILATGDNAPAAPEECWCVNKKGKEVKGSRGAGDVVC